MSPEDENFMSRAILVRQEAEKLLGARSWFLLSCYGKLASGLYSGRYVSGIPYADQLAIVRRLSQGETVAVHLMHRHRSGDYRSSSLRFTSAGLVMVFQDREIPA